MRTPDYVAVLYGKGNGFAYQLMSVKPNRRGWYKLAFAMGLVGPVTRRQAMRDMKKEVDWYRGRGYVVFTGEEDRPPEIKEGQALRTTGQS